AVTNAHVVEGAAIVKAYVQGIDRWLSARLVGLSTCEDLAVIDVSGEEYVPATLGESDEMTLGEDVMALGYPLASELGADLTINRGVVSKLHAQWDEFAELQDLIQTDTAINPGNSGGPLVNMRGEVIGINTLAMDYTRTGRPVRGLNFAIASSYARPIIERLASGENLYWIGANAFTNDPEAADYFDLAVEAGLFVYAVSDGSPAAEVGMETGDVLVTMKGINVYTMADVCDVLRSNPEGQAIPVQVIRGTAALEGEIWGEPLSAKFSLAPEWVTYTRQDLYFSLAAPGDWEISEDDTGATFSRGKSFSTIVALTLEDLTAEEANQSAIDYVLDYYADLDPDFIYSEVYAFPLGGMEGLTVDYEYVNEDGSLMDGSTIVATSEGITYLVEIGALEQDYEAELEIFNEMLFSLELFPAAAPPSSTAERLIDTFDDNRNSWGEAEDEAGNTITVAEGAYHIVSIYEEGGDNFLFGTSGVGPFANFDLDADATQVEGTDNNEIAVVFGVQDLDNLYEFAVSGDGYVSLGRYVEGAFEFIQEFTPSEAIIQGNATNHIRLIVENGNLTAYVNGQLALTSFVGEYESGYIGFGCGPFEEPGTHCAFDNLDLLALP
ncbi:MAG: trypsin-like peptidase domain-containing protein, partial [Anaerolineae bacterium]